MHTGFIYRLWFGGLLLFSLFCVAYVTSLQPLFALWLGLDEVSDNSGLLALACSCYLIYLKRHRIASITPEPNRLAGLALLILSVFWLASAAISVQVIQYVLLPLILMAVVAFWLGNRILGQIFIPIFILFFVLPIWSFVVPVLRDLTTYAAHSGLDLLGRPVFVQGYVLHLPGGSFLIDASCSGLRFLLVTLLLSCVSHDVFGHSYKQTAILISSGVLLSLVANWIRVIAIIMVGDYTSMESRLVEDHADLGWVIYGVVVLIPFFIANNYLSKPEQSVQAIDNSKPELDPSPKYLVFACALLLTGPVLSAVLVNIPAPGKDLVLPESINSWSKRGIDFSASRDFWFPQYGGYSERLVSRYSSEHGAVDVYLVYYADQSRGAELVNVNNALANQETWVTLDGTRSQLQIVEDGETVLQVNSIQIRDALNNRKIVWYWNNIAGRNTTSNVAAKLFQLMSLMTGRRDASLVAVAADCRSECLLAEERLRVFATESHAELAGIFELP